MPAHRKKAAFNALLPYISFSKARQAYFVYNNEIHALETCSTEIFKAAIHAIMTEGEIKRIKEKKYSFYHYDEIDALSRWHLLTVLKNKMPLYSKNAAIDVLKQKEIINDRL